MATASANIVLRHLRGLVAAESAGKLDDRQLLERFTLYHEQTAFEVLVRRHGPLVLGLCQRLLHNWHDAEDAFQATFLVLARKAGSIAKGESLGSWLYQVAYRLAIKARGRTANRQVHERQAGQRHAGDPLEEITGRDLYTVIDEELQQLPERYRAPLVLCHLQGKTRAEVASQLGWSLRTLRRRLEQGRECLRGRLVRRHLELPAMLVMAGLAQSGARAAVPAPLAAATVKTALGAAAGMSGPAALLAKAALSSMARGKASSLVIVLVAAILAVGAGWLVCKGTGASEAAAPVRARLGAPPVSQQKAAPQKQANAAAASRPVSQDRKPDQKRMTVTGQVLDATGKPVAQAQLAVLANQGLRLSSWEHWAWRRHEVIGQTRTDAKGRYRLDVPRTARVNLRLVRVVAVSPGRGLAWQAVDPEAQSATADLRLAAERVVRGRLVDIQGQPAAGVKVHVVNVMHVKGTQPGGNLRLPPSGLPGGIDTAATDARGYFSLRGYGPQMKLELEIRDIRYARQDEIEIDTGAGKAGDAFRLALPPPRIVEGRITYADTGKPVVGARVDINTVGTASGVTDAGGRYTINSRPASKPFRGDAPKLITWVLVRPPQGQPYLNASKQFDWPQVAVVRQTVNLALARGVVVHGKVSEVGSGQPARGAFVQANHYGDQGLALIGRDWAPVGRDGTYQIIVPPGRMFLTVVSQTAAYMPVVLGSGGGDTRRPVGDPMYFQAVVALTINAGEKTREVPITVRRGVTLTGRLVGPDGKPVKGAVMFIGGHQTPLERAMQPVFVRNGRFEVSGCDPARTYRLTFLEHPKPVQLMMGVESLVGFGQLWLPELLGNKGRLGAVVEISGRQAGKPVEVRMKPCGSVKLRFRDKAGKPLANFTPWLQLVVTPGPTIYEALKTKTLAAEVVTLMGRYGEPTEPHTDAQGILRYDGLIPGAVYRLKKTRQEPINEVLKDFTVEAGKVSVVEVVVK